MTVFESTFIAIVYTHGHGGEEANLALKSLGRSGL
jgi:hypothetical protein